MRIYLVLILFFYTLLANAQDEPKDIAIGQWRTHYAYQQAKNVCVANNKVYCNTSGGIFSYNVSDNSIETVTKINGLSDMGASAINFNSYNNTVVIGYTNGNIDLIQNDIYYNIPDLKNKPLSTSKMINNVFFNNQYAYLSCGFGIVVVNTDKREVSDTYYLGISSTYKNINGVTISGGKIYAATDDGVYEASLTNPFLSDYTAWTKQSSLPAGIYNTIAQIEGKVIVNYSKALMTGLWGQDTAYVYNGSVWSYFNSNAYNYIFSVKNVNNNLILTQQYKVEIYDGSLNLQQVITSYGAGFSYVLPVDATSDGSSTFYIADDRYGLIKTSSNNSGTSIYPNSPRTNSVQNMNCVNGDLAIASGSLNGAYNNTYKTDGVSFYQNNEWSYIPKGSALDTIFDIYSIVVNPQNSKQVYLGSFGNGLVEINNGAVSNIFNENNSSLTPIVIGSYRSLRCLGLDFDNNGNLWVANSEVSKPLSVKKLNNTWQSFDFSAFGLNGITRSLGLLVDKNNQKWIMINGGGFVVYNDNGTFASPNSSNTKVVSEAVGQGRLPSLYVYSIAEDKDGEIWVGTDKGVAVFYTPDAIFSSSNWDSQQIFIEQDGHTQILLETEKVTAIAVDGANRKWLGTSNGGVFLMSSDGTKELLHFDISNSPLPSNYINSIAVNGVTGEVFFGTDKGIISYKSTATEGGDDYKNVYAYPNPVRPEYQGVIAIKGLVKNAEIKITDINGNLIYQTKALGGQAIWDGKNYSGERAHTGVYLVFCADSEGKKTFVTKILFIN